MVDKKVLIVEEVKWYGWGYVIIWVIGFGIDLELDVVFGNLWLVDCFLLCFDGLIGYLDDVVIGMLLMEGVV